MLGEKRILKLGISGLALLVAIALIGIPLAQAQYWSALPTYNLLWPLWSPVLSPVDTLTGLATPLLTDITNSTILPVQPGLVWDPALQFPFLLYNIPPVLGGGLTYFEPFYGINPWPPSYLIPGGIPTPITLPAGYELLPPTLLSDFGPFVTQGNLSYIGVYPTGTFGIPLTNLLTPAQIWGLPIL